MIFLDSLKAVSPAQLIDSNVLKDLIKLFLQTSNENRSAVMSSILSISKKLADESNSTSVILEMLLETLDHICNEPESAKNNGWIDPIKQLICQGWLDILVYGNFEKMPAKSYRFTTVNRLAFEISPKNVERLLLNASRLLVRYLTLGSFEGCAGAKTQIVSLAEMVDQMFFVITKSETTALLASYQNKPEDLDQF